MRVRILLLSLHLFVVSLLPGADACELPELPALWAHHQQEHATAGFWSFFYDHYLGDHKDADGDHQSLPYHHSHPCAAQVADVPAAPLVWVPAPPQLLKTAAWAAAPAPDTPIAVAHSWWQPPRG